MGLSVCQLHSVDFAGLDWNQAFVSVWYRKLLRTFSIQPVIQLVHKEVLYD